MRKMSRRLDLLSELPQGIIETILTKLPIRDAVRTSILSTSWRYKWASMTHIVFDDGCVPSDSASIQDELVHFITRFLFLHCGPIHKFSLRSLFLQICPDIDQWLLFISRKDVKEIALEFRVADGEREGEVDGEIEMFRVPSCVFSCKNLSRLELARCELNPPPNFKGFLFLKCLSLQEVFIPTDDVECLISSCPLLESLTLKYIDSLVLTIRAPNLKYLIVEGEFKDLHLANTPCLIDISAAIYIADDIAESSEPSGKCNFDNLLGGTAKLERLTGRIYFTKYLCIGYFQERNLITHHHLKFIELFQVNFEDMKEVLVVFKLIVNSPNLKELQIAFFQNASAEKRGPEFWEEDVPSCYMLPQLKTVKLTEVSGEPHEMRFIKYLLDYSPGLQEMSITPNVTDGRLNMLIALVSFRRASPQASIIFHP